MEIDDRAGDSDIRRRAVWLLVMLAVVAGLLAVVMVFFLHPGSSHQAGNGAPYVDPNPSASTSSHGGSGARRSHSASPTSSAPATSSTTAVAAPSCPSSAVCTVSGDVVGAQAAINAIRSQDGQQAVTVTSTATAAKCAMTSGNDCPQSFVWVHVPGLSGAQLVKAVQGYGSNGNLFDNNAKAFEIGWAYDPASKAIYAAVVRDS